jgi:isopentenyl diphosphate isomerase/L-lactate dehydrogenase-like FMN-dependent dehydrogenase
MKKFTKKNKINITSNKNNTAKNNEKITESLIKSIKKKEHLNTVNRHKYLVQISKKKQLQIVNSNREADNVYYKKILMHKPSVSDPEINVSWDFEVLSQQILDTISPNIYSWYHENTSSAGNSTHKAIEAYQCVKFVSKKLLSNKTVSFEVDLTLHSNELGTTTLTSSNPFFTAPYGAPCVYGGQSDEISTIMGTITTGSIMTIPTLSQYSIETMTDIIKKYSINNNQFFMFQLYLTSDNEINLSIVERAKVCGAAIIIITVDSGTNNHGGIKLLENQADMTFQNNCCGIILSDPVFNIKCYELHHCIGTRNMEIINEISKYLNISSKQLHSKYKFQKSFEYARDLVVSGFPLINTSKKGDKLYDWSIENISKICHAKKSTCKYTNRNINKGLPLVVKGCVSKEFALDAQKNGADGIYVSNHGGRFLYNSVAPLDVLTEIRMAVKKVNKNFGVWQDGGIRNGQDILTSYAKGAEFVGVCRPIIYANVLYGFYGVSSIIKKLQFELYSQCVLTATNNLNNYNNIKDILV